MKRVVVIADLHCGHAVGLTPPAWQWPIDGETTDHKAKFGKVQREVWNWYAETIGKLQPVDILVVNGDAVDGNRARAAEMLTTDRNDQVDMACKCINGPNAGKILMIYGTGYHTGKEEDWERNIADSVKADHIGGHEWLDVNGLIMDFKHKIAGSTIPHGRMTAIARTQLWNTVWNSEHERQPKADVLVRSHVHYHNFCGGPSWLGMTTPALQGYGSSYGVRECEGVVDIGLVSFDVISKKEFTWVAHTPELSQCVVTAREL